MVPVLDELARKEIQAVSDLIKSEVNVKEIELIDEDSGILVKQIKPDFKKLGPRFGKDMKLISNAIQKLQEKDIKEIEEKGVLEIEINGKSVRLQLGDVEITSQDIEGWLVANQGYGPRG
jgi:isoleucyl-tRNA synthetase